MKTLILIRHSKTEQVYDGSKSDFERALLPRGHKDATLIANKMKEMQILPDHFVSSTAIRASQTAQEFAKIFDYPSKKIEYQQFLYDGYTTAEFLEFLAEYGEKHDSVIVFGHNPEIAMMAINLGDGHYYHFPTTAATAITFNVDNWKKLSARDGKTQWFMDPKQLK